MFLVNFITLLCVFLWLAPAGSTNAQLAPVQVDFGPNFLGDDGLWSPAQIRVGTDPEQWLLLLPNTLSSDTWVVGPGGCDGTQICQSDRGGLFYWNQSSTWHGLGYFDLGYTDITGASIGQYGLDNVSISDTISVSQLPVAIVNSTRLWIGQFGLNVKETRFNDNKVHLSFLSSLVQNLSLIPSHSYGYTAGAPYALKGVPGSLTLGGVDTTRFTSTSPLYTLGSNYEPSLTVVSIQASSAVFGESTIPSNWDNNPVTLSTAVLSFTATIDTSTPFLWFPEYVCDMFATALNLTYDTNLNLYVYPTNASAQLLKSWDLTFTFTLADMPNSTTASEINISFNAFNLQLSYPFPGLGDVSTSASVSYFPLRRANSTTQFTIGRAFLQETYLSVDYERSIFSLYPAFFPDLSKVSPNLVAITRPANSTWPGPQITTNNSLSAGAKAGIAVGAILVVLGIAGLIYLCIRKRRATDGKLEKSNRKRFLSAFSRRRDPEAMVPELLGDKRHPEELRADTSNSRFELGGDVPFEMPAGEVSSAYYQANLSARESAVARNDPRRPAELAHHGSTSKGPIISNSVSDSRSQSPVPPYSASDNSYSGQGLSNSISPNSFRNSAVFVGSESSGEQGISPINPHPNSRRFASINSQSTQSPISPVMPSDLRTDIPGSTESGIESSHLIPHAYAPARTASRNSRFREELLDEASEPSSGADGLRKRYSWEE